jgi:hypothetical protein
LAPAVSHALAAHGDASARIEICTPNGAQWVDADPSGLSEEATDGPESVLHVDHCPFCLHQADRVVPPPTPVAYLFLGLGGQQEVTAWQAFFYSHQHYPRAAPRGPPSFI